MKISFNERFDLPATEVFSYFETPREWTRLYGLMGMVEDLGEGWYSVPLEWFPFPLVARNTDSEPPRFVRWTFRGFWKGVGQVRLSDVEGGVVVEGFEEISVRYLGPLSPLLEKLMLERTFRAIWRSGWRRLRRQAGGRSSPPIDEPTGAKAGSV